MKYLDPTTNQSVLWDSLGLSRSWVAVGRFVLHGLSALRDQTLPPEGSEVKQQDENQREQRSRRGARGERLTFSDRTRSEPSARRSERRCPTWRARRTTCFLGIATMIILICQTKKLFILWGTWMSAQSFMVQVLLVLTSCHRTNQYSAEFDDGAQDVLGVGGARRILPVELEDQTLVLFLQQNQNVLQQNSVELWKEKRRWSKTELFFLK